MTKVHAVRGPHHRQVAAEAQRKPACVLACPAGARLFGDIHDPASAVSVAIRERAGYPLMPEWGTRPPTTTCRAAPTQITLHAEDLQRRDNRSSSTARQPEAAHLELGREDYATEDGANPRSPSSSSPC